MSDNNDQTKPSSAEFDFSGYPYDTLFHDRRTGRERREQVTPKKVLKERSPQIAPAERRAKKERRRRIDPTTFEKQYTADEMEFMNAMQRFKENTGKNFPTHGEVIQVAVALGYRRPVIEPDPSWDGAVDDVACIAQSSSVDATG
jgi:hypothetical protein